MLSIMMVLGSVSALAAGHTISVKDSDTHEYKVFQVLKGTLSEAGSSELGDPTWGDDATDAAKAGSVDDFITAITAGGISDQDIAQLVAGKVDTTKNGQGTIKKGTSLENLATGYYVLVDVTALAADSLDTKALHVVQVLNDINGIEIKWGTTTDEKKIVSDTLGKDDESVNTVEGDRDDVSVGDTVNYKITAEIPSNANLYNYFYFIINDTLDAGLTFNNDITVYVDEVEEENELEEYVAAHDSVEASGDYIVKVKTTDSATMVDSTHTFEVGLVDAKSLAGKTIIVTYSAVLNENAKLGELSNDNKSTVSFSNDPNHDYNGENENPGFPDSTDKNVLGETPETKTYTHTTGIEIQKVDQDGNVLTGATFEISGQNTKKVLTVAETFTEADDGNYYKLKNGTYTKTAPEDDAMVAAADGATKGYVKDADGDLEVGGEKYRAYKPAEDSGKTIYVLQNSSRSLYESDTQKYKKGETKTVEDATSDHKASKAVDDNGLVRFDGLGEGTYKINETVTPAGYNTLPELEVTISFDKNGNPHWSFTGGNGAYDQAEGIYKITIENNKGTELPSTGGVGTTIFYVAGSILVLAAAVLLITKRRMGAED